MQPTHGVAMVFKERRDNRTPDFLGSCFAYRSPVHFLTAAHVVRDYLEEATVFNLGARSVRRAVMLASLSGLASGLV